MMMDAASITPTTLGSTRYTIEGSDAVEAGLSLSIPDSAPWPQFQVSFPTSATGSRIRLSRGIAVIDLLPSADDGPPSGHFEGRHVAASTSAQGANTVLTCEIRATGAANVTDAWTLTVDGLAGGTCQLVQLDNVAQEPTITRVMCDPVAAFSLGGEAVPTTSGATVLSGGVVRLEASPAVGPSSIVGPTGEGDPDTTYEWSVAGGTLPGLPPCKLKPSAAFFAPMVRVAQDFPITLEAAFNRPCGLRPGLLVARTPQPLTLRVNPLGAPFVVDPPIEITTPAARGLMVDAVVDEDNGLVVAWSDLLPGPGAPPQVMLARLDLLDVDAGFTSPPSIPIGPQSWDPHLVVLPGGVLAVSSMISITDVILSFGRFADLGNHPFHIDLTPSGAGALSLLGFKLAVSGDYIVLFSTQTSASGTTQILYQRYQHRAGSLIDVQPKVLTPDAQGPFRYQVAVDPAGKIRVGYQGKSDAATSFVLHVTTLDPASDTLVSTSNVAPGDLGSDRLVALACDSDDGLYYFAEFAVGRMIIFSGKIRGGVLTASGQVPQAALTGSFLSAAAFLDSRGRVVFWRLAIDPGGVDVSTLDPASGTWSPSILLPGISGAVKVVKTPNDAYWVLSTTANAATPTTRTILAQRVRFST